MGSVNVTGQNGTTMTLQAPPAVTTATFAGSPPQADAGMDSVTWDEIANKPAFGTAALLNVPASAAAQANGTQVVRGDDPRLQPGYITANSITDASALGKTLIRAADPAAAFDALGVSPIGEAVAISSTQLDARNAIGLGSIATQSAAAVAITGGTIAGLASLAFTTPGRAIARTNLGIDLVDNTTDATKPVSTAQAAADALRVLKAGDTMTGNLTIANSGPSFIVNKAASGQSAGISGRMNGANRWVMSLGAGDAESGANAGSNFYITRCGDNGVSLGDVMSINRASGLATFQNDISVAGQSSGYGYSALGYGLYCLAARSAQNNSGTLTVYTINTGAGLGLASSIESWHTPTVSAGWRFYISGGVFEMRDNSTGYSAGGWVATSDGRVKTDNQIIDNALDKVDQLTGYTYLRQDMVALDGTVPRKAGVIAQDVLKVLPETVVVPINYNADTNEGDLLALHLDGVVGLLVNAVKELRAEVATLRARVTELEK